MKTDFRLKGLSSGGRATLELLTTDKEIFWADVDMPKDRRDALFAWAKNEDEFWQTAWIAEVEHEALSKDGTPTGNVRMSGMRIWDLPQKPFGAKEYKTLHMAGA